LMGVWVCCSLRILLRRRIGVVATVCILAIGFVAVSSGVSTVALVVLGAVGSGVSDARSTSESSSAGSAVRTLKIDVSSSGFVSWCVVVRHGRSSSEVMGFGGVAGRVLVGEHVAIAGDVAAEGRVVCVAGVEGAVASAGSSALVLLAHTTNGRGTILLPHGSGETGTGVRLHLGAPFDGLQALVELGRCAELPLADERPDGSGAANAGCDHDDGNDRVAAESARAGGAGIGGGSSGVADEGRAGESAGTG